MSVHSLIADSLSYPTYESLETLKIGFAEQKDNPAKGSLEKFINHIDHCSLGEWEELHTRTLDLNPPGAPYVGYHIWGDSYKRGRFMAQFNRALQERGIDRDGELPDHLVPILRYLEEEPEPMPLLLEILPRALSKMRKALRETEPDNPYLHLFDAILVSLPDDKSSEE